MYCLVFGIVLCVSRQCNVEVPSVNITTSDVWAVYVSACCVVVLVSSVTSVLGSPLYVSVDITVLFSCRCVRQGLHFSPGMHGCFPTVLESTTKGAKTENGGINLKFLVNHLSSISELEASHWGILSSIKLILF